MKKEILKTFYFRTKIRTQDLQDRKQACYQFVHATFFISKLFVKYLELYFLILDVFKIAN
jgi:hypothetical protein